jgi:glutaminyl-tRNA synthetase
MSASETPTVKHFIRQIIEADLESGKHSEIVTRFPPEPNGYLHIGHAKAICVNFGMAEDYNGKCFLRFDDTNPVKEEAHYAEAIKEDVEWLGFEWCDVRHASDYFDQLYDWAEHLINEGKAYVDSLNAEQIREYRGTLTEPGKNSPYRERSVEENLDLFRRMRAGEFGDGEHLLRAKIDMASPNMNLRDPALYRIKHATHHNTGDKWCIYPMYDFTHGQSDAIEHITHSLCSLEFEDHRPLYEWFIDNLPVPRQPRQIEFARLQLQYTITSKRKLNQLVTENHVEGWDDPRMPTVAGLRRRGYTPAAIRDFCERIGVSKAANSIDMAVLEFSIREDLNRKAPRTMAVLKPLKLVITNYPEDQEEMLTQPVHPQDESMGERKIPFCREVFIEREDFALEPPGKFKRLKPGGAVRLRGAYIVDFEKAITDENGEVVEVHVTYDVDTKSGTGTSERKCKGTIHWVSARHGVRATVRQYDRLFNEPAPDAGGKDFIEHLNQDSLTVIEDAVVEPGAAAAEAETHFQFERTGYFVTDRKLHSVDKPVFNQTVGLRDTWAKKG